jgi:YidC/Oxa1 family membrane protein insertase
MEKRFLLAIVLSFIILFAYQALFVKSPPPGPQQPVEQAGQTQAVAPREPLYTPPVKAEEPQAEAEVKAPPAQPVFSQREQQVVVETSLFRAVWSNKGAALHSWTLKEHKDKDGQDLDLVNSESATLGLFPFSLVTDSAEFDREVNAALYRPSKTELVLSDGEQGEITFTFADESGNSVEKTFVFEGGRYDFAIQGKVLKAGLPIQPRWIWGPSFGNPTEDEQKVRYGGGRGIAVYPPEKVERRGETKYDPDKGNAFNFVQWAAYEDNYFAAIFITEPQMASAAFLREEASTGPVFSLLVDHVQRAFIGPKNLDLLKEWGYNTKKIVKFGFFGWIAEILYIAIKAIHGLFPNWGFSIIILTILVKILFFPLTYSSTKSMSKMQALQPKIKALRAKYKKAKQDIDQRRKMNEEMMALYKKEGVNPAGGCLPLLIQLPIFWGFFRLLLVSVEFRQAPFLLWIKDLSLKDPFYVTPILMGITQYISQKMTPTSADPTQQRMMLIMPVVMTIFFMNFQSGLVLYWLTNNVLQIGQQYITNRLMKKKKSESHGKRHKKS